MERRRHTRVRVALPVEWGQTEECEHAGDKITRLSVGGCFVHTGREVAAGETVFISLWETSEGRDVLKGRVLYHLKVSPSFPPIGMGVEFTALSAEDASHLDAIVEFHRETSETFVGAAGE